MKKILWLFFLLISLAAMSQEAPGYQPSFSAVVVKNVSASTKWYQSVFRLKLKNEINDPNNSYKINILESPTYTLEILELKGSVAKADILKDKPNGTNIQGHFKIGFKISNADEWVKFLAKLNIDVPQVWADQKTGKKNFSIQDPDGNLIQFFE